MEDSSHVSLFLFLIPLDSYILLAVAELDFSKYTEKGAAFIFAACLQTKAIMNTRI